MPETIETEDLREQKPARLTLYVGSEMHADIRAACNACNVQRPLWLLVAANEFMKLPHQEQRRLIGEWLTADTGPAGG